MMLFSRASGVGRLLLALCVLGTAACDDPDSKDAGNGGGAGESGTSPDGTELTGNFTFGGKSVACKTSDQDFPATGEYSVLCDSGAANSAFVQVTFKNEASARKAQELTFMKPFAFKPEDHEAADAVSVSYSDTDGALDSDDESTGSARVTVSGDHNVLTLKDVSLSTVTSAATGEVSAVIEF